MAQGTREAAGASVGGIGIDPPRRRTCFEFGNDGSRNNGSGKAFVDGGSVHSRHVTGRVIARLLAQSGVCADARREATVSSEGVTGISE